MCIKYIFRVYAMKSSSFTQIHSRNHFNNKFQISRPGLHVIYLQDRLKSLITQPSSMTVQYLTYIYNTILTGGDIASSMSIRILCCCLTYVEKLFRQKPSVIFHWHAKKSGSYYSLTFIPPESAPSGQF